MQTQSTEKKWLVKSENKILGPYSFEQVEDLLLRRQISVIDEIRDTETRWLYLRENALFKKVVSDLRLQLDTKADATKTIQNSQSQTGTKPTEDFFQQTRSSAQQFTDVSLTQEASVVKETVDDIINRAQKEDASTKSAYNRNKKFAYQNDAASKKEISYFSKNIKVGLLILLILSLSGISSYYFYNKYNQQRIETELLTQVKRLKFLGLGQQAAQLYSKLSPALQKKYFIEVVDLYPFLEPLGFQIKNIDELESATSLSIENKVNIYLARFWAYMQQQNLELAQIQIVKAKTLQPADPLVNENEALLYLRHGKYQAALESFNKLYQQNNIGRYLFGALQSLQGLPAVDRAKLGMGIEKLVDRHIAIRYDFRKELLLAQMSNAVDKNNEILFRLSWQQFLATPAQLSLLFKKPALLAPYAYQWKDLKSFSDNVHKNLGPADDIIFKLHELLESSKVSEALDFFEKNKTNIADIPQRQQMALLVYYGLNRKSEVISLHKTNQLDKKSELNHLLVALTKIQIDPFTDVKDHVEYLTQRNLKFYADWVTLATLVRKKAPNEIRVHLKNNTTENSDFLLVEEARGLLD